MTSLLSRTAGSLSRRGGMRSVPADRRRTPNAMMDSMSLQAITPQTSPRAPERPAGRRARGAQDGGGPATGPSTGTGTGTGRQSDESPRVGGSLAGREPTGHQDGSFGLEPAGGTGGSRGRREGRSTTRPRGLAGGLDTLVGSTQDEEPPAAAGGGRKPGWSSARLADRPPTGSGDAARSPSPDVEKRKQVRDGGGDQGNSGRRFAIENLEDASEPSPLDATPAPRRSSTSERTPTTDRLEWFRHGWLGPLAVAVVVALVALGIYVLVAGRGGGRADGGKAAANATLAPAGTNPEAKAGKALVDGTYSCVAGAAPTGAAGATAAASTAPAAGGTPTAGAAPGARTGVLVVPATNGKYLWNGQQGDYTIATPTFDDAANVIAAVAFTTGPLQGQTGNSIAVWPAGGRVQATVYVTKGSNMSCALA